MKIELYVGKSNISGFGLFCSFIIPAHKPLFRCFRVIDKKLSNEIEPTNFLNHSYSPNCGLIFQENSIWIYSKQKLNPKSELTINYRDFVEMLNSNGISHHNQYLAFEEKPDYYQVMYDLSRSGQKSREIGHKYKFFN